MTENRKFEWDENKRRSNVEKHGIDFDDAKDVFGDPAAYTYASPISAEERRTVTVGLVKGVLIAVISTLRGSVTRIISARAARRNERQAYGTEASEEE
jgi:uncharacterized DUF497 family protein